MDAFNYSVDSLITILAKENKDTASYEAPVIHFNGSWAYLNQRLTDAFDRGSLAVVVLGSGVEPVENSLLALLSVHTQHPSAILGGRCVSAKQPQLFLNAGYWWSEAELTWIVDSYVTFVPDPDASLTKSVDWVSATALLIPRQAWLATGGFDLVFGTFLADMDLCLRARKAGFECIEVREALFYATNLDSPGDATKHDELRSTLRIARKHGLPYGVWRILLKCTLANLGREMALVGFWTDYGNKISLPKRVLWYLRNLAMILTRKRLKNSIRLTLLAAREAKMKSSTVGT